MYAIILLTFSCVVLAHLIRYYWDKRHHFLFALTLSGPISLPIIGDGLKFRGDHREIFNKLHDFIQKYPSPMKIWLGHHLLVTFTEPRHAEILMNSNKLSHKYDIYKFLEPYIGKGLVTASGDRWKRSRRTIQPFINSKFVWAAMEILQKHIDICIKRLEARVDGKVFDIGHYTHECFNDFIGEVMLNTNLKVQMGENEEFSNALIGAYEIAYNRLTKPWLQLDTIFNLTKYKKLQEEYVLAMKDLVLPVLKRAKEVIWLEPENGFVSIITSLVNLTKNNPGSMSDTEIYDQIMTLYMAGEDTTTTLSAFTCLCFGLYPEYQKKAFEEIKSVLGSKSGKINYEDLSKLKYLEMCLADVLRLFPIAPYILRKPFADFKIDSYNIPKGCCVMIAINSIHRNPKYWEKPDDFHPDHFLPEYVKKRHAFAYLPFSAGPRSCAGKLLGNAALKVFMVNILQNYELEADGQLKDVKLRADISVRSTHGYNVRIKRRTW